jgi:phosphoglycerate dehydrogenase-like enzyme
MMFKRMMILRNTKLNEQALNQIARAGHAVPKHTEVKAHYDAEEAELQEAIAESKALIA